MNGVAGVKLANLRDFDFDFEKLWETETRRDELDSIRPRSVLVHAHLLHQRQPASPFPSKVCVPTMVSSTPDHFFGGPVGNGTSGTLSALLKEAINHFPACFCRIWV